MLSTSDATIRSLELQHDGPVPQHLLDAALVGADRLALSRARGERSFYARMIHLQVRAIRKRGFEEGLLSDLQLYRRAFRHHNRLVRQLQGRAA